MKHKSILIIFSLFVIIYTFITSDKNTVFAGPQSSSYEIKQWGFGNGSGVGSTSTNYSVNGMVGEAVGSGSSSAYQVNAGLEFTLQANVPATPTVTNPGSNYDRLLITVNRGPGTTAPDVMFAIAISPDNFTTTYYVKSDNTIGTTLSSSDWRTYSSYGGTSGFYITRLLNNTTYSVKVKARQGSTYTGESSWSAVASAATVDPSLTFTLSSSSVTFNNLNSSNSYTDSTQSTSIGVTTNAYNGYVVYGRETAALTNSGVGATIPNYAGTNASPTTWSGLGFGYTTNDSSITGGTANRFGGGGAGGNFAGFVTTAPGDPIADTVGPILTPTNVTHTINYRVTAQQSTVAGTYNTNVIYVIVPTY